MKLCYLFNYIYITGDLGWKAEEDIILYEDRTTEYKILYERELEKNKIYKINLT